MSMTVTASPPPVRPSLPTPTGVPAAGVPVTPSLQVLTGVGVASAGALAAANLCGRLLARGAGPWAIAIAVAGAAIGGYVGFEGAAHYFEPARPGGRFATAAQQAAGAAGGVAGLGVAIAAAQTASWVMPGAATVVCGLACAALLIPAAALAAARLVQPR